MKLLAAVIIGFLGQADAAASNKKCIQYPTSCIGYQYADESCTTVINQYNLGTPDMSCNAVTVTNPASQAYKGIRYGASMKGNKMVALGLVYSDSACTAASTLDTFIQPIDKCQDNNGVYTKLVCTTDAPSRKLLSNHRDCLKYPKRCYGTVYASRDDCQNEENEIDFYPMGKPDLKCSKATHTNPDLPLSYGSLAYGATVTGTAENPSYAVVGMAFDNKNCKGDGTPVLRPMDNCYAENGGFVRIECN